MSPDANDKSPPLASFRLAGRLAIVLLVLAGAIYLWARQGAVNAEAIAQVIAAYPAAPLVFLGIHIVASLIFFPRTVLAVAAGALFGAWAGTLWAALGAYAFGSLVGQLPMAIACADFGAAGERIAAGKAGWLTPTIIGLIVLALSVLVPKLAARKRAMSPGPIDVQTRSRVRRRKRCNLRSENAPTHTRSSAFVRASTSTNGTTDASCLGSMFTRTSVLCAERIVAMSSSNGFVKSSEHFAFGYIRFKRETISRARSCFLVI